MSKNGEKLKKLIAESEYRANKARTGASYDIDTNSKFPKECALIPESHDFFQIHHPVVEKPKPPPPPPRFDPKHRWANIDALVDRWRVPEVPTRFFTVEPKYKYEIVEKGHKIKKDGLLIENRHKGEQHLTTVKAPYPHNPGWYPKRLRKIYQNPENEDSPLKKENIKWRHVEKIPNFKRFGKDINEQDKEEEKEFKFKEYDRKVLNEKRRKILLDDDFISQDAMIDLKVARLQAAKQILENQLRMHQVFQIVVDSLKQTPDMLTNNEKRLIYSLACIYERGSNLTPELCIELLEETVLVFNTPMTRNTQIIFDVLRENVPLSEDDILYIMDKYKIPHPEVREKLYPTEKEKQKLLLRGYMFPYADTK